MAEKFEHILDKCLDRITRQGESIDACLQDYPEHATQLEPLLQMAVSAYQSVLQVEARPELKLIVKSQMLMQLQNRQPMPPVKTPAVSAWRRRLALAAIPLVLILAGSGVVLASDDSLPGQPLYPVKTTVENVRLRLTPSELDKAQLRVKFAERRAKEMLAMDKRNKPQEVEKLAQRVEQQLNHIIPQAENLMSRKNGEENAVKIIIRLEQSSVLALSNSLPGQPFYPVQIAVEQTRLRLTRSELAQARLRIEFAERRVQEMVEMGKRNNPQEVEQLAQCVHEQLSYMGPLSEMMMSGQNRENDIEEISVMLEQAAQRHKDLIEKISEVAPPQARPSLEQALERSLLRYEQELQTLEQNRERMRQMFKDKMPMPYPGEKFEQKMPSPSNQNPTLSFNIMKLK